MLLQPHVFRHFIIATPKVLSTIIIRRDVQPQGVALLGLLLSLLHQSLFRHLLAVVIEDD